MQLEATVVLANDDIVGDAALAVFGRLSPKWACLALPVLFWLVCSLRAAKAITLLGVWCVARWTLLAVRLFPITEEAFRTLFALVSAANNSALESYTIHEQSDSTLFSLLIQKLDVKCMVSDR